MSGEGRTWHYEPIPVGGGFKVYRGKHPAFGFTVPDEYEARTACKFLVEYESQLERAKAALRGAAQAESDSRTAAAVVAHLRWRAQTVLASLEAPMETERRLPATHSYVSLEDQVALTHDAHLGRAEEKRWQTALVEREPYRDGVNATNALSNGEREILIDRSTGDALWLRDYLNALLTDLAEARAALRDEIIARVDDAVAYGAPQRMRETFIAERLARAGLTHISHET